MDRELTFHQNIETQLGFISYGYSLGLFRWCIYNPEGSNCAVTILSYKGSKITIEKFSHLTRAVREQTAVINRIFVTGDACNANIRRISPDK